MWVEGGSTITPIRLATRTAALEVVLRSARQPNRPRTERSEGVEAVAAVHARRRGDRPQVDRVHIVRIVVQTGVLPNLGAVHSQPQETVVLVLAGRRLPLIISEATLHP